MTGQGARRTRVLVVDRERPDPSAIADAARMLAAGGLVVLPTETVYGLGANALSPEAVGAIFVAKARPLTDPLIVHLASVDDLPRVAATVPDVASRLAARFWPGPLTLIVPKGAAVPLAVTAGRDTVAVRVPAHPVALAVLAAAGLPVAAPSANRFSRPSPTTAAHVLADLDGRVDVIVDAGPTDVGVESTIVDCTVTPPVIRRAGGVPIELLVDVVPDILTVEQVAEADVAQIAPGQLLRHYAPMAPLSVFDGAPTDVVARLARDARDLTARGRRVGILAPDDVLVALAPTIAAPAANGRVLVESLGRRSRPEEAARAIFAALRRMDEAGVDVILAGGPERGALGAAVWDRLRRAAEGRVIAV
jgi:L-threonylcarbamoyladenylate synthase